jgi:hypothetical protein
MQSDDKSRDIDDTAPRIINLSKATAVRQPYEVRQLLDFRATLCYVSGDAVLRLRLGLFMSYVALRREA